MGKSFRRMGEEVAFFGRRKPTGVDEDAAPELLPDGIYWQSGDATAKTAYDDQGWIPTTALQDVGATDTTTRVTSSSDKISILHVHQASPFDIAGWDATCRWKGDINWGPVVTDSADGITFSACPSATFPPGTHLGYSDETLTGGYTGNGSRGFHKYIVGEDDTSEGFMSASDSRPS